MVPVMCVRARARACVRACAGACVRAGADTISFSMLSFKNILAAAAPRTDFIARQERPRRTTRNLAPREPDVSIMSIAHVLCAILVKSCRSSTVEIEAIQVQTMISPSKVPMAGTHIITSPIL
jgi:hypothetical protein